MPAARQRPQQTLSISLAAHVRRQAPVNILPLNYYYRSGHFLLRQADEYRSAGNQEQLFVILMRLCSLVVETIPFHRDFQDNSPQQQKFKKLLALQYLPELERLKASLDIKGQSADTFFTPPPHVQGSNTTQLATSNLPELDWGQLDHTSSAPQLPASEPTASQAAQPNDPFAYDPAAVHQRNRQSEDPFAASQSSGSYGSDTSLHSNGGLDLLTGSAAYSQYGQGALPQLNDTGGSYSRSSSLKLPVASQAALNRHAIMPQQQVRRQAASRPSQQSLYPQFDKEPLAPVDYGINHATQPSAPALPDQMASMQLQQGPSLMDAPAVNMPRPQLELQLGPQQMQVHNVAAPAAALQAPQGDCCEPAPMPAPPSEAVVKREQKIREVHVSAALMEEFLRYSTSNTRSGIESCGILAGSLREKQGVFVISTLIIPKQEGTSDTVQALNEEEIFDVQDKRALYPLGWIHTHPTQTCFLSSVDVHTQCGYQTMLDEAVAIVMAPRDSRKKCGIFRLSTPGGLKLVQKCPERGFHAHPSTQTGQSLYELCGHVYLNPRVKHDVVDLR
ncbi:hypothetical protein WJX82_002350 [Trebouxia sp. C0006]